MKNKCVNYIISELKKLYPNASTKRIEDLLYKSSEDDVYRIANMIDRFGIEILDEQFN